MYVTVFVCARSSGNRGQSRLEWKALYAVSDVKTHIRSFGGRMIQGGQLKSDVSSSLEIYRSSSKLKDTSETDLSLFVHENQGNRKPSNGYYQL